MSKHTPGPWKINAPITAPTFPALDVRDDKGWLLAQVQSAPDMTINTTAFNAALIAAAPDMREAIAFSLDLIEKAKTGEVTAAEFPFKQALAHKKLREALEKAEGKR